MGLRNIPGQGMRLPAPDAFTSAPAFTSSVIDATGEKFAWVGQVFFQERTGTKNITKVGFRFGTVTKAGGSGLTVSLQNVNTAAGPAQPDETQDQTVAIANGDAGFASNAFYMTGALSASRAVSFGEPLAVVAEYDGGGRLGADAVNFSNINTKTASPHLRSNVSLKTASWTVQAGQTPNVVLEFDDGTFGALNDGFPASAINTHTFNSGTGGADEYAMRFSVPFPCRVDGGWAMFNAGTTSADFDVVLYDGTTAMTNGTATNDAHTLGVVGNARMFFFQFPGAVTLEANKVYRLAFKPTTANNVSVYTYDVVNANHFQGYFGGTEFHHSTRVDAGAWSDTTTRRIVGGISFCAFDDGGPLLPALKRYWFDRRPRSRTPAPLIVSGGGGTVNVYVPFARERRTSQVRHVQRPPRTLPIAGVSTPVNVYVPILRERRIVRTRHTVRPSRPVPIPGISVPIVRERRVVLTRIITRPGRMTPIPTAAAASPQPILTSPRVVR